MSRKSRDELREQRNQARQSRDKRDPSDLEAIGEEERQEVNDLFTDLNKMGWETMGGYQVATEGPEKPKIVTLSVVVPSTNDWDPSEAFTDE